MTASISLIGLTVAEAFSAVVENDSKLLARRRRAIVAGGEPVSMGFYYGGSNHVLAVTYGRVSQDPIGILKPMTLAERKVRVADRTFELLFSKFIDRFSSGELLTEGLSKLGSLDPVPRSLWSNDRMLLDLRRGDLLEFSSAHRLGVQVAQPAFRGLMIRAGSKGYDYPPAETNSEVLIREACQSAWHLGIPAGFPVKARNNKINAYIEAQGGEPLSPKTIERYFKK
jgi:hypothetical protein